MSENGARSLRDRYAAIAARLDADGSAGDWDGIRQDIANLYEHVDYQIAQLAALKGDVKRLAERWRAVQSMATYRSTAPRLTGAQPTVRTDHLNASSFVEKGWSLIALGDHPGAERALAQALRLAPGDSQAELLFGWALMLQEKYDDALASFERVLEREPQAALARVNIGYIYMRRHRYAEAIEQLTSAARADGDRKATLYAHFYLGLVYLEREMYEDAQTFFRKTLQLGPNLIEAYYELGRALWFDGQRDAAMDAWRDGHRANKFNPWGKRCGEMLKHVEGGGSLSRSRATA
jgi:tetratricopeptide (TPR) repeat protein